MTLPAVLKISHGLYTQATWNIMISYYGNNR